MNLQLLSLVGYSILLISVGAWIGRRVDTSGGFFVAGRSLGPILIFGTILAANIGAGSTVGVAGLGYRDGVSAWWWVGSAGIGTLILGLWLGPKIRRLAAKHEMHTVGDYLEFRYGREVRATIAILLWLGTLAILAGQLIAMAWILEVVAGVPKLWGCLLGGIVVALYFSAGGLLTSAWVNLVQLVVLVIGFSLALFWVMPEDGFRAVIAAAPHDSPSYLNFWKGGSSGLRYIALLVPAFIISPGLIQKVFGARDDRAVRLGVGASGLALMVFALVPPLLGMIARTYDPSLANPELALPTLLTGALPPFVGGLALAAVLSAELSSADAILFMLSTSLSKDLYGRFLNPRASDATILKVSRLAALGGGALGVGLAIILPSVIGSLSVFYSLLSVSLFVPIVAGLLTRRPGTPEALTAIGAGVSVLLATRMGALDWLSMGPTTAGLIASAVAFGLFSIVRLSMSSRKEIE
jgi:SSS family solute:Na+ symporter